MTNANTFHTPDARLGHAIRIPLDAKLRTNQAQSTTGWSSTNWSGYAVTNDNPGHYYSVSATWVVPSVRMTQRTQPLSRRHRLLSRLSVPPVTPVSTHDSYSATWIGIDGFNNTQLIQIGTAQNVVNGSPQYYAWWEILPAPETGIDVRQYPVKPGDTISASIERPPDARWQLRMHNETRGWTFTLANLSYTGPQTSVEWIEEAPQIDGGVSSLANYGSVTFRKCAANGANPQFVSSEEGVLVQGGRPESVPSNPGPSGNDFVVQYGWTKPSPPVD